MAHPSFSVVVETDNLELTDLGALRECLDSLRDQQPAIAQARGVFLVNGGQVGDPVAETLGRDYPWLTIVRATPGTLYVGLKAQGVGLSDSDVIIFCDADIRYDPGWLDALLSAFVERPDAQIVGGETTTPIHGPYSLAFALTFVFPRFTGETALAPSPVYWANNVAIRRAAVERFPIPDPAALYRGQNILHSLALIGGGLTIWRQPRARAQHIVLSPKTIVRRYLTLGRDSASVARLTREASGAPFLAAMAPDESGSRRLRKLIGRVRQVARARPLHVALLPLALPIVGALAGCYLVGRFLGASAAGRWTRQAGPVH
jgi:glycosyltransferase involved in cell wall biosynthesis